MELELNNQETTSFVFDISLIPDIKYKITEVNIPGISVETIENFPAFSDTKIKIPGDTIDFDDLNITFIVDKKLNNYYYLFNWIKILINAVQIENIDVDNTDPVLQELTKKEYSDAILFIYTGDKLEKKIRFENIFPYNIGEIQFSTTEENSVSICTATFKYEKFDFMD